MNTLGIVVNTKIKAVSQYAGLTYNSLAVMSGKLLGANSSGIFMMTADDTVTAYFETKHFDFDLEKDKQLRKVYLSGVFKGSVSITSVINGVDSETVTILSESVVASKTYVRNFSADHKGRYIGLKIANVNGMDFSVDAISVIYSITENKSTEVFLAGRIKGDIPDITISASGV